MATELRDRLQSCLGTAYALDREIGGGGMSRVFVAEETAFGRRVVVKVVSMELAESLSAERFKREIKLAAKLQHPHIVPLLSAGDIEGLLFYTMPYVEGESLRDRLEREPQLPIRDVVRILKDLASALAYAHSKGIVHRDIKPENVLFSADQPLVVDFGIAKALSESRRDWLDTEELPITLTQLGTSVGTPAYMAPEQAAGDPNTDARADWYSLGIVAYEMLAGVVPFEAKNARAVMAAHATKPPEPVIRRRPDTPARLADLVMRLIAKEPADRPQSGGDVLALLEEEERRTRPSRFAKRIAQEIAGRWMLVALATGAIVLLAIALMIHDSLAPREASRPTVSALVPPPGTQFAGGWNVALSTDGSRIAFVAGGPGNAPTVWFKRLDTLSLLGQLGVAGAAMPFWSPDGNSIGFFAGGRLQIIDGLSSTSPGNTLRLRSLCPAPHALGAVWARDDAILFVPDTGSPVYRVAPRAANAACVAAAKLLSGERGHARPVALADGHHFIFQSWPLSAAVLYIGDFDAQGHTTLKTGATSPAFVAPDHLLFLARDTLWAQHLDMMRLRLDGTPRALLAAVADSAGMATYAASGFGALVARTGKPTPGPDLEHFTLVQNWKAWVK